MIFGALRGNGPGITQNTMVSSLNQSFIGVPHSFSFMYHCRAGSLNKPHKEYWRWPEAITSIYVEADYVLLCAENMLINLVSVVVQ